MSTYERTVQLGFKDEEVYSTSFDMPKDSLVKDEKWEYIARALNVVFRNLYDDGLLLTKCIDVRSFCETSEHSDYDKLCVEMLFDKPKHLREQDCHLYEN